MQDPLDTIPEMLSKYDLTIGGDAQSLVYTYDVRGERTGITQLLSDLSAAGMVLRDVQTRQSSLEDIFVSLVREQP